MKFFMLINIKLLTMPNSFLLNIAEHENFSANKYENAKWGGGMGGGRGGGGGGKHLRVTCTSERTQPW